MARTYTDKLEYRRRTDASASWTSWQLLDNDAATPFTFAKGQAYSTAADTLDTGYEYEFRITRSKPGSVSKVSDGATDGTPNYISNGVSLSAGSTLDSTGTYTVSLGGVTQDVTRTKSDTNSLKVKFNGNNWNYVAVKYTVSGTTYRRVAFKGNSTSTTISADGGNTYTTDSNVIANTSSGALKEVTVKLGSSQSLTMYIDYNGSSSGSLSVSAL